MFDKRAAVSHAAARHATELQGHGGPPAAASAGTPRARASTSPRLQPDQLIRWEASRRSDPKSTQSRIARVCEAAFGRSCVTTCECGWWVCAHVSAQRGSNKHESSSSSSRSCGRGPVMHAPRFVGAFLADLPPAFRAACFCSAVSVCACENEMRHTRGRRQHGEIPMGSRDTARDYSRTVHRAERRRGHPRVDQCGAIGTSYSTRAERRAHLDVELLPLLRGLLTGRLVLVYRPRDTGIVLAAKAVETRGKGGVLATKAAGGQGNGGVLPIRSAANFRWQHLVETDRPRPKRRSTLSDPPACHLFGCAARRAATQRRCLQKQLEGRAATKRHGLERRRTAADAQGEGSARRRTAR